MLISSEPIFNEMTLVKNFINQFVSLLAISLVQTLTVNSQTTAWFADGYHGGVYGHYPDWVTSFMLDELDKHPYWRINLEIEPETWDSVKIRTPEDYLKLTGKFRQLQSDHRLEIVNPAYAQPYGYNISGESLIRQFHYGIKKTLNHFPSARFITYSSEEPCFTSALPAILRSFGFRYAVLKNPDTCWGGYTRAFGGELVNWVGPDGTKIITVPRYEVEKLEPGSTWQTIAWKNSPEYIKLSRDYGIEHPVGMCFQDAGWKNGPWLGDGNQGDIQNVYVTWTDYFENVTGTDPDLNWNFSQEDVLVSLVWGSQVLQKLARQVRIAENKLVLTEKLATIVAAYNGSSWPEESIDQAWPPLLLAQHHDCWIVPYNGRPGNTWADKVERWTNVTNRICDSIIDNIWGINSKSNNVRATSIIRIHNTLGIDRNEIVTAGLPSHLDPLKLKITDSQANPVPFQITGDQGDNRRSVILKANVQSMGYCDLQIYESHDPVQYKSQEAGVSAKLSNDGSCTIESDLYRISIDAKHGGIITSLVARQSNNREFVSNDNRFRFNEITGYFYDEEKYYSNTDQPAKIDILENGPLMAKIRINGRIAEHPYIQLITVVQGQRRIDIEMEINWQHNPHVGAYNNYNDYESTDLEKAFYIDSCKLVAWYPVRLESQKVYKNAPFDVCESRHSDTFFSRWDSIKHNIILNWIDVADQNDEFGLTLLSDHTTAYTHGKHYPPGLVIQYAGKGLWGRDYRVKGKTELKYALLPHEDRWDKSGIWTEGTKFNEPLVAAWLPTNDNKVGENRSLLQVSKPGYEITTASLIENDLVVRIFNAESDNEPVTLNFNCSAEKAERIALNGEAIEEITLFHEKHTDAAVRLSIPRFGFSTLKLSNISTNQ